MGEQVGVQGVQAAFYEPQAERTGPEGPYLINSYKIWRGKLVQLSPYLFKNSKVGF